MYKPTDIKLLKNNISEINKEIKIKQNKLIKPTFDEKIKIHNFILNYIKTNNRKIYGGYALNKLLINKGLSSFYDDHIIPDIDIYSPDPNQDVITLCNMLVDEGYDKVNGREAKHLNTYSIFVNYVLYCDITYTPHNIYNKIQCTILDDFYYVNPSFMHIDYLKIMTDPMNSYWRIEKSFERLALLTTKFPLPKFTKPIIINTSEQDNMIQCAIGLIINNIINKDIIVVGFYAYNYFLEQSKISDKYKQYQKIKIPYLELISKNYKQDFDILYNLLCQKYDDKISIREYYPFFTFTGYSVEVYLQDELILILYDYSKRSHPYLEYNNLKLGTFSTTLMYSQINVIKFKTIQEEDLKLMYMILSSHLLQMQEYYFTRTKHTIFDNTPFKEFVTDCIIYEIDPDHEILMKYEKRRSQNKPSMFIYDPIKNKKEVKDENYFFSNISGNEILNEKRSQLFNKIESDNSDNSSETDQ